MNVNIHAHTKIDTIVKHQTHLDHSNQPWGVLIIGNVEVYINDPEVAARISEAASEVYNHLTHEGKDNT